MVSTKWVPHWMQDGDGGAASISATETGAAGGAEQSSQAATGARLALPVSADVILEALKEVEDPELAMSIVDLGLVYGIEVQEGAVLVRITLTTPGCPIGPMLQAAIHGAVQRVYPDVKDVKVELVWYPPWDPYTMASEEAKDFLGIW